MEIRHQLSLKGRRVGVGSILSNAFGSAPSALATRKPKDP